MFVEQLRRAVEASPRIELPKVSALLWKAYAAEQVTEAEASELSDLIEAKRTVPVPPPRPRPRVGSRPRTPESLARRRRWVASGLLPPALASRFTAAENAVLAVIAAENRKRGDCRLTNKEVAENGKRFEAELPLNDAHGKRIGALGVVLAYKAGDDKEALTAHAVKIRDEMAAHIASPAALVAKAS